MHASETDGPPVCKNREQCLHLVSSSGRYTHIDGAVHRRVPFGTYKIGLLASGREHKILSNDVIRDPGIHDRECARELGLVSFAGYRIRPPDGERLGVLALFSKKALTPEEDAQLDALSTSVAQVIGAARTETALRDAHGAIKRSFAEMQMANEQLSSEIAERQKAEKELYRANREIESLIASIPLIIIEVSNDGIIKRWNAVAEKVFQIKAPEALGIEILKCPIPWEREKVNKTLRKCSLECVAMRLMAVRFTRANGKEGLLDLTISSITESAFLFSGHIILGVDITEHALLER